MNKLPKKISIDLGDKRLNKRYVKIVEAFLKQPSQSIPGIFQNWHQTKAIYRFFDNPKVTYEKIIEHLYKQTISHIKNLDNEEDILILQDTTHLNYDGHKNKEELFKTHPHVKKGLKIHPSIAVTSSRINLGLLQATMLTGRKDKNEEASWKKKYRPIEKKESYKWLKSFRMTQKIASENSEKTFFNIADRQGDIYDLFLEPAKNDTQNAYFIVRSSGDRNTTRDKEKVREAIKSGLEVGEIGFEYKRGNKKRFVKQNIKVKKIELDSPTRRPNLDKVDIWVVQAQEKNPPKGEDAIQWLIVTNYPVESLEDAKKILHYYTIRWDIEIFFKVLKSGCKAEEVRLETLERLKPCLALYMSVACRIMFLLKIGKTYPNLSCNILFSTSEWQVAYMFITHEKPPKQPPKLSEMIVYIAQMGGYLNRKNDPPPGPKAMWIGIQKLHMMALGFELYEGKN